MLELSSFNVSRLGIPELKVSGCLFSIRIRHEVFLENHNLEKFFLFLGCKSQEKRGKSHKYDPKSTRFKKKAKESSLRHLRASSQHQHRSASDEDDEDESIPASYHTVSLQVSQDVSIAWISSLSFPAVILVAVASGQPRCGIIHFLWPCMTGFYFQSSVGNS